MKRFFLSLAVTFVTIISFGQTQLPVDENVRIGKLENGLTYYIRHNDKPAQRAEFYLATNVGAFQEADDQDGLAHFLEHMCFNGTKNFPDKKLLEYDKFVKDIYGWLVGDNGYISKRLYDRLFVDGINSRAKLKWL